MFDYVLKFLLYFKLLVEAVEQFEQFILRSCKKLMRETCDKMNNSSDR